MTRGLIFWILMLLAAVLGFYWNRNDLWGWTTTGIPLWYVLFLLLGWDTYGPAIRGGPPKAQT